MAEREGGTFEYANPETIHWGSGCVAARLPAALDRLGAARVFLVTTRSAAREPALFGALEALLGPRLVGHDGGIGQHAPAEDIARAAEAARKAAPDAIVSLGGGSPIDAAKALVFALASGLDLKDPAAPARARSLVLAGKRVLPHFAIPTTLSVAELADSAGFSAPGTREKVGLAAPELRCAAVFYDARYAVHTPLPLWLSSGVRALDHAVETLLAPHQHPLPDAAALDGIRRLREALPEAKSNPQDEGARTSCQLGAWLSYLLPGPAARGLSHTLGKRIGSRHGIPHGVTSGLLLPHVMRFYAARKPEPLERIAVALGKEPSAAAAADAMQAFIASLGLPQRMSSFNLTDKDLIDAVRPLAGKELSEAELLAIMRAAD